MKIWVRTECRPVSRPSRKGELAETASSSGSTLAEVVADRDRPVGAADADVGVQAPGVVAAGDLAEIVAGAGGSASVSMIRWSR